MHSQGTSGLQPRADTTEEMSLRELASIVWSGRWLVVSITAFFVLAAVGIAWMLPTKYTATALLAPATEQAESGSLGALGSMASQFGGLASLAGLNVQAGSARAEAVATLESEALTRRYIEINNLLPVLFADDWDTAAGKWKLAHTDVPTLWKGNELFKKHVRRVSENTKTGLITLTITWKDPQLAAKWAADLVSLTNDALRERAIAESTKNIAYLSDQASKAAMVELRNAIFSLMESEVKKEMLARGNTDYALKIIDPPTPPEERSSPLFKVWVFAALCLGLVFAVSLLLVRAAFNASPQPSNR